MGARPSGITMNARLNVRRAGFRRRQATPAAGVKTVQRLLTLESLVHLAVAVAVTLIMLRLVDYLTAGLVVHDAAAAFANVVRDAQVIARDTNRFVRLSVYPASPAKPSRYRLDDGRLVIMEKTLAGGVSGAGTALIDPQGIPQGPTQFKFSKCGFVSVVNLAVDGLVSMP